MKIVQAMYRNTQSRVRINSTFSDSFRVKVVCIRDLYLVRYFLLRSIVERVSNRLSRRDALC